MAPTPVTNAARRFVLTADSGSGETNVAVSSLLPVGYTSDQVMRAAQYQAARNLRAANPGVIYRLYSPANLGGNHLDSDLVWRSDVSD
jgi:hypothetical protein